MYELIHKFINCVDIHILLPNKYSGILSGCLGSVFTHGESSKPKFTNKSANVMCPHEMCQLITIQLVVESDSKSHLSLFSFFFKACCVKFISSLSFFGQILVSTLHFLLMYWFDYYSRFFTWFFSLSPSFSISPSLSIFLHLFQSFEYQYMLIHCTFIRFCPYKVSVEVDTCKIKFSSDHFFLSFPLHPSIDTYNFCFFFFF